MSDENKDPELQTWIDPELEARVVAWVLGEASEFEAAELARIVAEKPELAIFKKRIEAVHGLVAAASKMELDPPRMSEDRRRKLIERLGQKEAGAPAAVVAMPLKATGGGKRSPGRWLVEIAVVLIILAALAGIAMPRFSGVMTRTGASKLMLEAMDQSLRAPNVQETERSGLVAESPGAPAPAATERLVALDALKALANSPRIEDEEGTETVDAAVGGVAARSVAGAGGDASRAKASIESGDAAMKQRDYETAFAQYKAACDALPDSDETHLLRRKALDGLDDAGCSLAEERISEGRYQDATNLCKAVLDPAYDPDASRAVVILAHLENPDYYNQTITPRFAGNVEEVKRLFAEAKGYEQSGRSDKAYEDYEKILNMDPYNDAARKGEEEVNGRRDQYANQAYEETRSQLLWEMDKGWNMPVHKFGVQGSGNASPTTADARHTEYITSKLNRIIIPKLDFHDATIREAIDFLKEKSVQLDTQEPDPTRRGVNIVDQTGDLASTGPAEPASLPIPGLEAPPAPNASPAAGSEPRITLSLSNIPVGEALKYIAQLSNQKLKIDPYAVSLVPPSVNTEEMVTKEYKVDPGFLAAAADTTGAESALSAPATRAGGGGGGAGEEATEVGPEMTAKQKAMDYLTANGVQFPPGASAIYFPATKRLIIHNTSGNLALTDAIVESTVPQAPAQSDLAEAGASTAGADASGAAAGAAAPGAENSYLASTGSPSWNIPAAPSLPSPAQTTISGAVTTTAEAEAATAAPMPAGAAEPDQARFAAQVQGNAKAASAEPPTALEGQLESNTQSQISQAAQDQAQTKLQLVTKNTPPGSAGVAQTGQLAFNGPSQPSIPATTNFGRYGYAIKNPATVITAQPPPAPVDELAASDQPYSTFSLHVSDVSFLLASAELASGQMPDPASIRPEEFYNAFDYGDPAPATGEKIACHIEQAAHPILQQHNLVRIAMKVAATGRDGGQPLRLTVLLDTSGSMEREDRAASVQRAMQVLTSLLGPNDAVTLIGFARQPRLLAEEVPGDQAGKLVDIVKHTPPEGGTNMEEAIKTASELALRHFEKGGQNRVVMLTDGAANLGDADPVQLSKLIDALRQQGVSFDACGVGADGLNDDILEALTRKGGGRYYFLNQPGDADEGFAQQLAGAFRPAAENVKMQVRFNPDRVGKYKLIGFEKNRLNQEDFRNDNVTAAQLAAEEAAVALYQVQVLPEGEGEIGEVFVRFRDPADGRVIEQSWTIPYDPLAPALDKASPSMQLATTASLVAEKLRGGPLADAIDMDALEPVVTSLRGYYAQQTRVQDFATMFEQVRRMTARK